MITTESCSSSTSPRACDAMRSPARRFLHTKTSIKAEAHSPRMRRSLSPSCFVKAAGSPIKCSASNTKSTAGFTAIATGNATSTTKAPHDHATTTTPTTTNGDTSSTSSTCSTCTSTRHDECVACCSALCPELIVTGRELQDKVPLYLLFKKGKRFDSAWEPFYVGIFGPILYFFEQLHQPPKGIVPLHGATIKAVDCIFRNTQPSKTSPGASPPPNAPNCNSLSPTTSPLEAEDCGPCWKLTTSANRVFLFRTRSVTTRNQWIARITQIANQKTSTCRADHQNLQKVTKLLRDAMRLVDQQKKEIETLKKANGNVTPNATGSDNNFHGAKNTLQVPPPPSPSQQMQVVVAPAPSLSLARIGPASSSVSATGSNDDLQRKANELAEFARSLQSSFNISPVKPTTTTLTTSMSMALSNNTVYECTTTPTHLTSTETCSSPLSSQSATTMSSHDGDEVSESTHSGYSDNGNAPDTNANGDGSIPRTNTSDSVLKAINNLMERFLGTEEENATADKSGDMLANIHLNLKRQQSLQRRIIDNMESVRGSSRSSRRELGHARSLSADEVDLLEQPEALIKSSANGFTSLSVSFDALDELEITPALRTSQHFCETLVGSDMGLVGAILSSATRDEKMSILMPVLRLFAHENRLNELIFWAIDTEVDSVMDVTTLFRSDDYATRLLSTYSKSVGLTFIKHALKEPIRKLCASSMADFDLQPSDAQTPEELPRIAQNATNLMNACQEILNNLLEHSDKIPTSYYHICGYLREKASQRFEEMMFLENWTANTSTALTRSVLGGFLFLRFICPAITTPHMYELLDEPPSAESRRLLVLVTKLLFKTATYVMFGEKEPCLRVLNSFVAKNAVNIERLYTRMTSPVQEDIATSFANDSRHIFFNLTSRQLDDDLRIVRTVARIHLSAVESKLRGDYRFPQQQLGSLRKSLQRDEDELARACGGLETTNESSCAIEKGHLELAMPRRKQKKLCLNFLPFGRKARKSSQDFA